MKRLITIILTFVMVLSIAGCEGKVSDEENTKKETQAQESTKTEEGSKNVIESENKSDAVTIKPSPDKYTWYIKNYAGKNCASLGYTSLGGDRFDRYGSGLLELVFVNTDGTYIDVESDEMLKEYTVIGQNLAPNTELKLTFAKDSEGKEYGSLIDTQSYEEIILCVKKIGTEANPISLTEIKPSPDKYTWYISDYVGRNLRGCGYISLGGDFMDEYGDAAIRFVIVANDGSYIDPTDESVLKSYVVTGQSVAPNSELKLIYSKDSSGKEYDSLVESKNIEEIELYVSRINDIK